VPDIAPATGAVVEDELLHGKGIEDLIGPQVA
jgi:hypothetical protein